MIIRPETLVRWHRSGFRRYWRWKSRSLGGRPQVDVDLRALIQRMSAENPLLIEFAKLLRWEHKCPSVLRAIMIIRPETLVRWHRSGFRRYWRWKSRSQEVRDQAGGLLLR
jgi:hypothetical protein